MRLLVNRSVDAAFNLALEELIASKYQDEAVMLWRNAPSIIVGRNQNTESEINGEAVRRRGIPVVRRITGGGAVYHDLGNVNYTITVRDRQMDGEAFARNAEVILQVLRGMGVPAVFKGRNDILADGRKISGSAKSVLTDRTLFHGTLLFDVDMENLVELLSPDEEKIRAKGIRSIRARVANIREFLPELDVEGFLAELERRLLAALGERAVSPIPEALIAEAEKLADGKYRTWLWNFGSNTAYSYCRKARFAGGSVEVRFNVSGNRMEDVIFQGDFFGRRPVGELAEKLNGIVPKYAEIAEVLTKIETEEYMSGISSADLLTLFRLD